jgi:hypothetical protein
VGLELGDAFAGGWGGGRLGQGQDVIPELDLLGAGGVARQAKVAVRLGDRSSRGPRAGGRAALSHEITVRELEIQITPFKRKVNAIPGNA